MLIENNMEVRLGVEIPEEALRSTILGAKHIVLVSHTNADGDAVGSVMGMYLMLKRLTQAQITPILPDGCPDDLAWLPHTNQLFSGTLQQQQCLSAINNADLIIALDISSFSRTGQLADTLIKNQGLHLLIDHHEGPTVDQFNLIVSQPDISSTCELVYWTARQTFGTQALDHDIATCLYTGICTDTGTFRYSNTQASVYLAAAEMLRYGIDPMEINRSIVNVFSPQRLQFFGYATSSLLTVYPEAEIAIMVIHQNDMQRYGVQSHELTGLVNEVMRIRCIDCAILIREEADRVRLSFRSKKRFDVNQMAKTLFDGGGHIRAAGATSTLTIDATVEKVKHHLGL